MALNQQICAFLYGNGNENKLETQFFIHMGKLAVKMVRVSNQLDVYIILRHCWSDIFQNVHASDESKEIIHKTAFMRTHRVLSINSL